MKDATLRKHTENEATSKPQTRSSLEGTRGLCPLSVTGPHTLGEAQSGTKSQPAETWWEATAGFITAAQASQVIPRDVPQQFTGSLFSQVQRLPLPELSQPTS